MRPAGWDWRLVVLLAAVFAVKTVVVAQLQHHPLLEPDGGVDSSEYVALARRVLAGDVFLGPGLYYLSPLYVYFLAALLAVSDSFAFVRMVQIGLGTAAVWCIFVSARAWFGERAAWLAAVLAALTGVFTFYEIVIFQSSIDTFLTAAALASLGSALVIPPKGGSYGSSVPPEGGSYGSPVPPKGGSYGSSVPPKGGSYGSSVPPKGGSYGSTVPPEVGSPRENSVVSAFRRNTRNALLAGIFFGLQFLNRPNIAIAIGAVALALLATRHWRTAVWLTAGIGLALAPVVARNAIVTHQFALTSSQGGLNFYIGNHASATGQYVAVPGVRANMAGQAEDTRKVAEAAVGHSLSDADVSSYFRGLALSWIREHPASAATLFARKLALTFNARHQWLDYSYPYYAYDTGSMLGWLFVGPWLLVPLGLAGVAATRSSLLGEMPARSSFAAWFIFLPAYAVSVALFFVAERYRLPLFVPLSIVSGAALDRALEVFRQPSSALRPPTSVAIALGIAGAILTAWPFHLDDGRFEERLRLSKVLMNNHDYGGAAVELERASALRPSDTTTEFNLGMAWISNGRVQEGLSRARHAVETGVPIPGARYALANAVLATGDRDGAVALLRTYQPAPEDSAESCYQVAQLALNAGAPLVAERYLQRALQLRPGWPEAMAALEQIHR